MGNEKANNEIRTRTKRLETNGNRKIKNETKYKDNQNGNEKSKYDKMETE